MSGERPLISIIVPVYNEAENVRACYDRVVIVTTQLAAQYDFEFLFTDNHSSDATFEILRSLSEADERVRCIRFSRNFGYQNSIFTGYLNARGDAAIQLDADLQDPPELIPSFLEHWQDGNEVVYGIRRSRQENFIVRKLRGLFYWMVDVLSDDYLPRDAGDFRLVSRRILDELNKIRDQNLYLRGLIAGLGFRQTGIPYDRDPRQHGQSKFSFFSLIGFSLNAFVGHSILPLRLASVIGLITAALMIFGIVGYLVARIYFGSEWPPGFVTLTILQLLAITLNALFLGIIGEYIGRVYTEVRDRPVTVVETTLNVEADAVRVSGRSS